MPIRTFHSDNVSTFIRNSDLVLDAGTAGLFFTYIVIHFNDHLVLLDALEREVINWVFWILFFYKTDQVWFPLALDLLQSTQQLLFGHLLRIPHNEALLPPRWRNASTRRKKENQEGCACDKLEKTLRVLNHHNVSHNRTVTDSQIYTRPECCQRS